MLLDNPVDLKQALAPGRRLLGFDLGSKTIGLALSDRTWTIAQPFKTLRRRKFRDDAADLAQLAEHHDVGGFVIGLPVNMDGSEGPRCQSTRQFQKNLSAIIDPPTLFWDERLSTAAVTRTLIEADQSRARRAQVIDKMAAAYILQGLLDAMR
jgi:putative Holliday junction resolvase